MLVNTKFWSEESKAHERPEQLEEYGAPTASRQAVAITLAALCMFIAAGGGIGGGSVLVPIFILIMHLSAKEAIPLANMTVVGGAITNFVIYNRKKHPAAGEVDRPLIDWDFILLAQPLTIGGAILGTYLNKLTPEWFLSILLVVLLIISGLRTVNKALAVEKATSKSSILATRSVTEKSPLLSTTGNEERSHECCQQSSLAKADAADYSQIEFTKPSQCGKVQLGVEPEILEKKLNELLRVERAQTALKIFKMCIIFVAVVILTILKGGGGYASPVGIDCPSFSYWALAILPLPLVIAFSIVHGQQLYRTYLEKRNLNYEIAKGDIEWSERKIVVIPIVCFVAGIIAGTFGLGGGIVYAPLMLELHMLPEVVSATTATMVLFTSAASGMSFMVFGNENYHYAIAMFLLGVLTTFIGQVIISKLIKKFNRPSLIIFSVATIILLAAMAMGFQSFRLVVDRIQNGPLHTPVKIC